MEPDGPKLGLYSRFVEPEARAIIAEIQLTAAQGTMIFLTRKDSKTISPFIENNSFKFYFEVLRRRLLFSLKVSISLSN